MTNRISEEESEESASWSETFDRHPLAILCLAFGTGMVAASMASKRTSVRSTVNDTWEQLKGALFAVGTAKVIESVAEAIPRLRSATPPAKNGRTARAMRPAGVR